jgi:hypothetical protein
MLVYVHAHYHIFCSVGNVLGLPATSPATVRAMQMCTVVDVAYFFPWHPSPERRYVLPDTTKDMHVYANMATFQLWTCMFLATSDWIQSIQCVSSQTYWCPTKQDMSFENKTKNAGFL